MDLSSKEVVNFNWRHGSSFLGGISVKGARNCSQSLDAGRNSFGISYHTFLVTADQPRYSIVGLTNHLEITKVGMCMYIVPIPRRKESYNTEFRVRGIPTLSRPQFSQCQKKKQTRLKSLILMPLALLKKMRVGPVAVFFETCVW